MKHLFYSLVLFLSFAMFFSCKPTTTTVEEDQQAFTAIFDSGVQAVKLFENGPLFQNYLKYIGFHQGALTNQDRINNMIDSWAKLSGINEYFQTHGRVSMDHLKGLYEYNDQTKSWQKNPDDKITISFRLDPSKENEIVKIIVREYQDILLTTGIYVPAKLNMSMLLNSTELNRINAAIEWFTGGYPTINRANIELFAAPFTQSIEISKKHDTEYSFFCKLFAGASVQPLVLESTIKLELPISEEFFSISDSPVKTIYAKLSHGEFAVQANIDTKKLDALDDSHTTPTADQINEHMRILLFHKGEEVGSIKLEAETYEFRVYFRDDNSKYLEDYYKVFIEEIDRIRTTYRQTQYKKSIKNRPFLKNMKYLKNMISAKFNFEDLKK